MELGKITKTNAKDTFHSIVYVYACSLGIGKKYLNETIYLIGLGILIIPVLYIIYTEYRAVGLRDKHSLRDYYPLTVLIFVLLITVSYFHLIW
jgi:hypothetical protein